MQRRMKKIFSLLLASAMVLALVSCGKQATETPAEESTQTAQEPAQTSEEPAAEHTIDTPAAEDSYLPVTVSYIYGYRTADDGTTIASSGASGENWVPKMKARIRLTKRTTPNFICRL